MGRGGSAALKLDFFVTLYFQHYVILLFALHFFMRALCEESLQERYRD